ncbi:MAG: hypothetical protein ACFBWO_08670 [Paracoccaceae bacterium]
MENDPELFEREDLEAGFRLYFTPVCRTIILRRALERLAEMHAQGRERDTGPEAVLVPGSFRLIGETAAYRMTADPVVGRNLAVVPQGHLQNGRLKLDGDMVVTAFACDPEAADHFGPSFAFQDGEGVVGGLPEGVRLTIDFASGAPAMPPAPSLRDPGLGRAILRDIGAMPDGGED